MAKTWKNPTRPDESPITVTHNGWEQTQYRNYLPSDAPKNTRKFAGRTCQSTGKVETFDTPSDYQKSKTKDAQIDKALDKAIKKDLENRGI